MRFTAVALVSAAAIAFEVLLVRLYAIVQWHHFAFMIISIALLGYGVSGTFIALAREWLLARYAAAWQVNAALFGLTTVLSFALVQRVPFNPLAVVWEPAQLLWVAATYLILMVPFFFAANCVGLAFAAFGGRAGRVYRYDLVGAGLGAAAVIGVLFVLDAEEGLRLVLALGFAAAAIAAIEGERRWPAVALVLAGLALAAAAPADWIAPRISEYKGLSAALRVPGAEIVATHASPLGQLAVVRNPEIPFRHAPGLSLNATADVPEQLGLFVDGQGPAAITRYDGTPESSAYLDFMTEALPYHLLTRPRVLVLGAGTGAHVLLALHHEVPAIEAVEVDPAVADLVAGRFAEFSGGIYAAAGVRLRIADARAFAAASRERYDLIQVPILDTFAAAAGGVRGLGESYLHTREAFADYLARLAPGGLLAVSRWLKLPPRDSLKLFATAIAALETTGAPDPADRLVLIRGWKTTTLLVKNGAFTAREIAAVREFAASRAFDVAYYPEMPRDEANRYNLLAAPFFHDGAVALLGSQREEFLARYKFDLTPATDDRPYFFDFFRWRALPELVALRAQGAAPFIEWGTLILFATLAQAVVLGTVLVLAPVRALATGRGGPRLRIALYFIFLGLGFLFVEIAFIQRFVQFLGHPLYAVAVVLAAFLVFAGLGAGVAQALDERLADRGLSALGVAALAIASVAALYLAALGPTLRWLIHLPQPAKVAVALALIAPLAVPMGMPFPLGVGRLHARRRELIPWAWGINGCASVVSAVLATLLALHLGFGAVITLAAALYLAAWAIFRGPL